MILSWPVHLFFCQQDIAAAAVKPRYIKFILPRSKQHGRQSLFRHLPPRAFDSFLHPGFSPEGAIPFLLEMPKVILPCYMIGAICGAMIRKVDLNASMLWLT